MRRRPVRTAGAAPAVTGAAPAARSLAGASGGRAVVALLRHELMRWVGLPALGAVAVGVAISQALPPAPAGLPAVDLASEPIYGSGARAKPTLSLALSVEYPTVGAQYRSGPEDRVDASYSPANEYIGYFDSESCYAYNDAAGVKRFDRSGPATGRQCGGAGFSGNFMNWASSSAIDILRLGLTGGDRVVDTPALTVLQRAVLPNGFSDQGWSAYFWNNGVYFPTKQVSPALARGALPTALIGSHTGDIYVSNCLNRIHFGTRIDLDGNCMNPGGNADLGGPPMNGPARDVAGALPGEFEAAACADEDGRCEFTGVREVAYGAGTRWKVRAVRDGAWCINDTFGDPAVDIAKTCHIGPASTWAPDPPAAGKPSEPYYYARVSVCAASGGTLLERRSYELCQRYPSGGYKPVGNLQKYSDRLRVAAFGYLIDNGPTRYGGVLRAPMKYVGEKRYDDNFVQIAGGNPAQEWDPTTGVFVANPEGAVEGLSGVTNYLNRFGRVGDDLAGFGATDRDRYFGRYKEMDPVGELYYETLRYLQGLPPTPDAVSGITETMRAGFPVYTTWADPHPPIANADDYSCVRNNIVTVGDIFTHRDKSLPGNTRTDEDFARPANPGGNEPDFTYWTRVVGGFEANNPVTYADGEGRGQTSGGNDAPIGGLWGLETRSPNGNKAGYNFVGAAFWANTHDIRGEQWGNVAKRRPGMRATTWMLDVNEKSASFNAADRHRNQFFLAAKYGGFRDRSETGSPFRDASGGASNSAWEKPDDPGEARTYFLASSARAVLEALDSIFEAALQDAKSIAGGATSSQRITSDGFVYQAEFDPSSWSGDLVAYPLALTGDDGLTLGDPDEGGWRAAEQLDERPAAERNIVIGKAVPDAVANATSFTWDAVDAGVRLALRTPPGGAAGADSDAVGRARLEYLRGSREEEMPAGAFRRRDHVLGDIVNSGIAYADQPTLLYSDPAYVSFQEAAADRPRMLYVGANDGMLHGFDAETGAERLAYIPSWLAPRLSALTQSDYAHQAYVDSTPAVREARVGTTWKSVLIGGSGGGGQGVYALDVSDPTAFGPDKLLWEFTDRDDPALGNVIGTPDVLRFRVSPQGALPEYRYFAVVASGVNNYVADEHFSATGNPAIFLLDVSKPRGDAWQEGTNYHRIELPRSVGTLASGVAGFSAWFGAFDEVAAIYAGDLHGNLWKLDFRPHGRAGWSAANLIAHRNGDAPAPMFVALDATGNRQPITGAPTWMQGTLRQVVVGFGTGRFLSVADAAAPFSTQSYYAVLDDQSTEPLPGRNVLQPRTAGGDGTVTGAAFVWSRPVTADDTVNRAGWYVDFPGSAAGERSISAGTVIGGRLIFGSIIPGDSPCDLGSGNEYVVDAFTGGGEFESSEVGLFGQVLLIAVRDVDAAPGSTGAAGRTTTYRRISLGSKGVKVGEEALQIGGKIRRLGWREIANFQASKLSE